MFAYEDCLESLKQLARTSSEYPNYSHCQKLDLFSKKLGFNNFYHFQKSLKALPTDIFSNVSLSLMRKLCKSTKPSLDVAYYEFYSFKTNGESPRVAFYSSWIGYDKFGREVRIPRSLNGLKSIDGIRGIFESPVYVVESDKQLLSWLFNWHGVALITEELAKDYFHSRFNRRHRVADNVPSELIEACNEDYNDNVAS